LVVGIDEKQAVARIWGWGGVELRELGTIALGGEKARSEWDRWEPDVAWHPVDGVLVLAGADGLWRWSEHGEFERLPGATGSKYSWLAFSPDGTTVWAAPSSSGADNAWQHSDALDWETQTLTTGLLRWDSDVVEHPGGGLVVTMNSDQGATTVLFAQVSDNRLQVLRRALILDVDGYEAPVFSADGRYFAIRGDSYAHQVEVFRFPSLEQVFVLPLGDGDWSFHNLGFVADTLLIGTPEGKIVQLGIDPEWTVVHEVSSDSITALAVGADGSVHVATAGGLQLLTLDADHQPADPSLVTAFIDSTSILEDLSNLDDDLDLTDGTRSFGSDELDKTEPDPTDPTWLQIRTHLNALPQNETP
jgi:hypothetical protein